MRATIPWVSRKPLQIDTHTAPPAHVVKLTESQTSSQVLTPLLLCTHTHTTMLYARKHVYEGGDMRAVHLCCHQSTMLQPQTMPVSATSALQILAIASANTPPNTPPYLPHTPMHAPGSLFMPLCMAILTWRFCSWLRPTYNSHASEFQSPWMRMNRGLTPH